MIRMQIQARNLSLRRQNGSQLQLCVPQVFMNGLSYRPSKAPGRVVPPAKTSGSQALTPGGSASLFGPGAEDGLLAGIV
jgi:hypothetical protein